MPKAFKWIIGIVGAIVVLIILAIVIAPLVIDLNKYKPMIENQAAKALGRPVRLGGELEPSVFPWVGVKLTDVHIGNPAEFENPDFVSVNSFEVRVKLLPLLSRTVEVSRLVLKEPAIVLEKSKSGKANWEDLGPPAAAATAPPPAAAAPTQPSTAGLPIKALEVGEFAIRNGRLTYSDQTTATRHEVHDFNLTVNDFSLDRPLALDLSARIDGNPLSLKGALGPLGTAIGKSPVPLDLQLGLLNLVRASLKGRIDPSAATPRFDLNLAIEPFSPRKLADALKQPLPLEPADAAVLQKLALAFAVQGTPENINLSDGVLLLDDSRLVFSARAKDLARPDLTLKAALDQIDVDRYLPPPTDAPAAAATGSKQPAQPPTAKPNFAPLRKLLLDAEVQIDRLKVKNAHLQNILVKVTAKNGVIRVEPRTELYSGQLNGVTTVNVQQDEPRINTALTLQGVQAAGLIQDLLAKEVVRGVLSSELNLQFSGLQEAAIRRTLSGQGRLRFNDGAIVGIDLADMVRNVQTAFGLAERPAEKPQTDFSEMLLPFTVDRGVTQINGAQLNSPLLRVLSDGTVDLVKEKIDLRVNPKFVGTLVGQGDAQQRGGVMVPVLIQGSLSDPQFRPDLKGALSQQLPGDLEKKKESLQQNLQKKSEELFKKLPFGK